ncbi:hypothetical protein [Halobacillus naozhouensis]|uniref:Uncharacterized protein n=1 Tax=Halobacillus naozhouensis TaxID=554880 RepID=A0ABY8J1M7_9BACI|nr:hypothetical protein [Halobacillus naozhouensis]WFT74891.1 hypothetical protein P9989_00175 [Halobacillus naozhouensis]
MVTVKAESEDPFKFEFSPIATRETIRRALPVMIKNERNKRYKKAIRREQLAEQKRKKAERSEGETDE